MRIEYLELSGFRGYCELVRIEFGTAFTVIDGRNGVGKSTICDAIEFALTGTISKYGEAKADGESVQDYIWWLGEDDGPEQRYVEVGFSDGEETLTIKRTSAKPDTATDLEILEKRLCDEFSKPSQALKQLCESAIIRDEHIASLSLDLKETERYARISSSIGVVGSTELITRAQEVHSLAREVCKSAQQSADEAAERRTEAVRQLDAARVNLTDISEVNRAENDLLELLNLDSRSSITEQAAKRLADIDDKEATLVLLTSKVRTAADERSTLIELNESVSEHEKRAANLQNELSTLRRTLESQPSSGDAQVKAQRLALLAELGRELGLEECACPLCSSEVEWATYEERLEHLENVSSELDKTANEVAEQVAREFRIQSELKEIQVVLNRSREVVGATEQKLSNLAAELRDMGFEEDATAKAIEHEQILLNSEQNQIRDLLKIVDTNRTRRAVSSAQERNAEAEENLKKCEVRLARAKRTEQASKTLLDGVRKAAGDALDLRIERILPLISEMYSRLRPHPTFTKIDYKIRGELRKHLSFRVGSDLNPQFVFSSGQRRAAGLAFLLSVNLSIAWSRWKTVLLDDPVQHIDDFRSVHLAELLGHLVNEGRQIICSVEDPALADLLCRKMPARTPGAGKRISLGFNEAGSIVTSQDRQLPWSEQWILRPTDNSLSA